MPLDPARVTPLMAITQEGPDHDPLQQTAALLAAGVRWIQLRMKNADEATWAKVAPEFVQRCRQAGAVSVINDRWELALRCGADGVHLGASDLDWVEARRRLGPALILGGTVNTEAHARQAKACGVLDYVGVGPWRFTHSKKALAPVLGAEGVAGLLRLLSPLPAWVIGGIEATDTKAVRALGAAGVAVCGALYRDGAVAQHVNTFQQHWNS